MFQKQEKCPDQKRTWLVAAFSIFALFYAASGALAQLPDIPPTTSGFPPLLPKVPQAKPRPPQGPDSVGAFVESLSVNDTAFQVVVGQGRILTTKADLAVPGKEAVIAIGDPSVIDFVIINNRQIRITGLRTGVTDLAIITADNQTYSFDVRVVADLDVLNAQLQQLFPDARVRLGQIRDHVVVQGEARDTTQVAQILETVRLYLVSVVVGQERKFTGGQLRGRRSDGAPPAEQPPEKGKDQPKDQQPNGQQQPVRQEPEERGGAITGTIAQPKIINLLRVPTSQQVLLKVRVAELNRTAMRQIGADFAIVNPATGTVFGTQIGGANMSAAGLLAGLGGLVPNATFATSGDTTAFGIFENNAILLIQALRRNGIVKILAEPNLVTMHGHPATFLAGGEFPVPIPQTVTGGGVGSSVTVSFKEFGVRLGFVPYILDDNVVRLTVAPEVSTLDFSIGTTLVPGGDPVPGLNTRRAATTVELKQGQTLAIAGLLQVQLDANTSRIPIMGDLPVIGTFFSNTTNSRIEKELLVLVTPYLVEGMNPEQVGPAPGDELREPTDWEFYLHHRIEGRDYDFRSTLLRDLPHLTRTQAYLNLERQHVRGPFGFCDQ